MPKTRNTGGSKGPRKKKTGASTEASAAASGNGEGGVDASELFASGSEGGLGGGLVGQVRLPVRDPPPCTRPARGRSPQHARPRR